MDEFKQLFNETNTTFESSLNEAHGKYEQAIEASRSLTACEAYFGDISKGTLGSFSVYPALQTNDKRTLPDEAWVGEGSDPGAVARAEAAKLYCMLLLLGS